MKSTLFSSALVTFGSLISFANAGYYGAAPAPACSTATHETCATAYGANKPYGALPTNVKTISSTKLVTSTAWKPAATYTVTGKDSTVTKQVTTTCTVKKQCAVKTIYVTHVTTSTKTIDSVYTSTKDVTVKKTGAAYTVPTPYGFVNVADDSYNKEHIKRDYGNYYGNAPQSYATAVHCTKTLGATCTTTVTKQKSPAVTHTVPGKTKTVTHTNSVYVTVCANPTVKTVTAVSTCTVSTTKKSTVTVTKTITSTLAGPTTYAACNSHNLYSGSNGVSVTGAKGDILVAGINSAYDCCVACQKHQTYGKSDCAGSYFTTSDSYSGNKCYLRITNTCPSQSSCTLLFKNTSSYGSKTTISNGACGRWHCSA